MTGADAFFEELRKEYLLEAPVRLAELRKDLAALAAGEADAAASLKTRFHRLAGSGGSYGFPDISTVSRRAERWLAEHPVPDAAGLACLEQAVAEVAGAFDSAARALGFPVESVRFPAFAWRALVLSDDTALADRVHRVLVDQGYTARTEALDLGPAAVAASERPDLVLITAPGWTPTVARTVGQWTASSGRPRAAVLVVPSGAVDPLGSPLSGLDALILAERIESELATLARSLAQTASLPYVVAILDPDPGQVTALAGALEAAGVQVEVATSATRLLGFLGRQGADLVLTEWELPDADPRALLRVLRQGGASPATQIVIHVPAFTEDQRAAAIRAGADDVLLKATDRHHAVAVLLARVGRGRHLRNLGRHDGLTGLLSHAALVDELEGAISLAGRAGEALGLVVLDPDHFRRVNERHGHAAGDRLLADLAAGVRRLVRSSDAVGRIGGDKIGILARRCPPDSAAALAEKLRRAAGEVRVTCPEGSVGVRLSAGVACFPAHAASAPELLRAALAALAAAKEGGRDRTAAAGAPASAPG